MPSSDSEEFESADEGHTNSMKKERKKRHSSSQYSDSEAKDQKKNLPLNTDFGKETVSQKEADGWDDFDIEDNDVKESNPISETDLKHLEQPQCTAKKVDSVKLDKPQEAGWGDFDDWGQDDSAITAEQVEREPKLLETGQPEPDIKSVTDRLAATSTKSSNWGWGWGVDSLISSATAGITTLTSQVSQGISTVLETGIGAPDPEELARQMTKEKEVKTDVVTSNNEQAEQKSEDTSVPADPVFPFGSILSGVTKFVETTGTKVLNSGLDTLETIGKKTMEVLQDGDPGLAKKRAMLGLDSGDKPILSQVLREAKSRADEEDKIREEKREAKEVHYENLFDDFEGLVHLEALEMLSRQVNMRIEERLRTVDPDKRQDIKETLQQVAELCEMPEEEEEDEEEVEEGPKEELFHERLQTATQDLGLKLQFQPIVKQYTEILDWQRIDEPGVTVKSIYKRAVSGLAQCTALSVEVYHKAGEMLLVKARRSTADESDALTQMTVVLTKHISELATLFTEKLNSIPSDDKDQVNTYTTNIFLEAGNSSTYIQNAFQLILPILQIGAV